MLVVAGEDDGLKLISTIDSSIVRVFEAHNAFVVSLAFDPNNDYLTLAGTNGTIMRWSLSLGKRIQGDVLAVLGKKNGADGIMYDRDRGEKVFSLKGGQCALVRFLAWSPNGKYLATALGANQVIPWDVNSTQDIASQKFEAQICSLAWKPKGNALAVIDSDGKFGVWEPVVPAHIYDQPSDNSIQLSTIDREELLHFSDDDKEVLSENENKSLSKEKE